MAFERLNSSLHRDRALVLAQKYVWWKQPEETLAEPVLLVAQMMTLGTLDDVRWMLSCASADELRAVLRDPPVGVFNGRSWTYWQRRLNGEPVPPLPARILRRHTGAWDGSVSRIAKASDSLRSDTATHR